MASHSKERMLLAAVGAWGLIACAGIAIMMLSAHRAGPAVVQDDWPDGTRITSIAARPALLVFLHPRCPCSEATVAELARALRNFEGNSPIHIIFSLPHDADASWRDTDLIHQVRDIPGTDIFFDEGGIETARFGVHTSGQMLLYDGLRRCVFSGGITPMRGHEGDTPGRDVITQVLVEGERPVSKVFSPVYGCAVYHLAGSRGRGK